MIVQEQPPTQLSESRPKRRPTLKAISGLVVALLIFVGGVAVGRQSGDDQPSGSSPLDYSSVSHVYDLLKSDFDGDLDNTKLIDGLKSGLVSSAGDPYTAYFSPEQAQKFDEQLSGSFIGIGAELGTDDQNHIVVVSPLAGYPAEKAGLKPKDIIAAIDGKTTNGMSVDAAVSKIRGEEGTKVKLTVIRGSSPAKNITIIRRKITIPSVKYKVIGDIGYIQIAQFNEDTVPLAQKAVKEFQDQKVKGIILDLRGDPGGYLPTAVAISSLWLDPNLTVVQERRGTEVVSTETSNGDNPLKGIPTVVLIDGGSASASEITAGALHDHKAATLVGVKSFGKGSVQKLEKLNDGSEVKITIARWYTPDGKNIDKQGIKPDIVVKASASDVKAGRDPQKAKALAILRSKIH